MKSLLVLGAGRLQTAAITAGKRLGLRVVAADNNALAPGLMLADRQYVVDITDSHLCVEIARAEQISGVLHPCSEVAMHSLAAINEAMGLHGPGTSTVRSATNKGMMRAAFERAGAPSPTSFCVSSAQAAVECAQRLAGDWIIKPSRSSGSRGVSFVPRTSPRAAIEKAFNRALNESREPTAMVEQFIEGPEFSVEILVWNGEPKVIAVTDKLTTGVPYFVEMGHSQPTQLSGRRYDLVVNAALAGVRALDFDWCAAHAEVKLCEDNPYLMEIGARLGGDFITTDLVPLSSGVDMVAGAIQLSIGECPDLQVWLEPRGAAIRYLSASPGIIRCVSGEAGARAAQGVVDAEIYARPGARVFPVDSSLARVGHVIAEGSDAASAITNATRAAALVVFEISS